MPTYIDPPSGWQYGFPKALPDNVKNVKKWLIEQGYPKQALDAMGDNFYCRYWYEEPEDRVVTDRRKEEEYQSSD